MDSARATGACVVGFEGWIFGLLRTLLCGCNCLSKLLAIVVDTTVGADAVDVTIDGFVSVLVAIILLFNTTDDTPGLDITLGRLLGGGSGGGHCVITGRVFAEKGIDEVLELGGTIDCFSVETVRQLLLSTDVRGEFGGIKFLFGTAGARSGTGGGVAEI